MAAPGARRLLPSPAAAAARPWDESDMGQTEQDGRKKSDEKCAF